MRIWVAIGLVFLTFGQLRAAGGSDSISHPEVYSLALESTAGKSVPFEQFKRNKATAFVFLSPECPLCQNYSLTLKTIDQEYTAKGIEVVGVFPGKLYSRKQIRKYLGKFDIDFSTLLDPEFELTKMLGATITPEVVLLRPDGSVQYAGAIDNWAYGLAKKRRKITAHYLRDAIASELDGAPVQTIKTEAVGCFIYALPEN